MKRDKLVFKGVEEWSWEERKFLLLDDSFKSRRGGLFLEPKYALHPDAVFTTKDEDWEYDGRIYVSLKQRYLDCMDPTGYEFANRWLLGWKHWKVLHDSSFLAAHFKEWEEEMEVKVRSEAILSIMDMPDNFQAVKYIADKGYEKKGNAGRPKREDKLADQIKERVESNEYNGDVVRMFKERA